MGLEAAIGPTVTRVEYARSQTLYVGTDDRDPAAFANAIRGIPHRSPRKTTTGTPRTPATEEPPTGFGSRIQAERPASSDHATALLGWIPGVTQIDLPCPVATNVIFAIDDAGHGHAVSDGAHLAELHRAAAWWNQNRRLIAALHPAVETTSCIHLHVVTRDHPVAVALAAGGYRCHWITRGTAATDSRLIAVEITPADS
jgi:hypothetical protein